MTTLLERKPTGTITKTEFYPTSVDYYEEYLYPELQNTENASGYLSACLADGNDLFFGGLLNVIEARKRMRPISNASRATLNDFHSTISTSDKHSFTHIVSILGSLGIEIEFKPKSGPR